MTRTARPHLTPALLMACAILFHSCGTNAGSAGTEEVDTTGTAARRDSLRKAAIADSLSDGYHVYKDQDGRPLMEGTLKDGLREGVWTSYLPNGRPQSRNVYKKGVLHGITTVFHENGVLYYSGTQRLGKPFGEWKFYDNEGKLARTVVYDTTGTLINDLKEGGTHR